MFIPQEYLGWFKAGVIVGLDIAFFIGLILWAYMDNIERWIGGL